MHLQILHVIDFSCLVCAAYYCIRGINAALSWERRMDLCESEETPQVFLFVYQLDRKHNKYRPSVVKGVLSLQCSKRQHVGTL